MDHKQNKVEAIKLLEENRGEIFCALGLVKDK